MRHDDKRYYQVRRYGIGSWLDPRSRGRLAADVGERLGVRCKGEKGVVLTLTYKRDSYDSPRDLYLTQSAEQHVPLFIRKLTRRIGVSFTGKWFRKLEFQSGGWVHFHIILLGVSRIDHAIIKECWGKGHVFIQRLNQNRAKYLCKYIAKSEEDIPSFILIDRPRSFKVIAVSPGFWRTDEDVDLGVDDEFDKPDVYPRMPMYVSLGQRLEDSQHQLLIQDQDTGYCRTENLDLAMFLIALKHFGVEFTQDIHGRLAFIASESDQLVPAIAYANRKNGRSPGGLPPGLALPLLKTRNPDARHPRWVDLVVCEELKRAA